MGNKAVFLDRDGTIAPDVHYCSCPEHFELFPDVPEAIRLLNDSGFKVVIITNQSGIARGFFTEETLEQIHNKMERELARNGAKIDAIYYCPHHPDDGCDCRKPKTLLFHYASQKLDIDLSASYVIGDMTTDLEAGRSLQCKTILMRYQNEGMLSSDQPDYITDSFMKAILWIMNHPKE